ncbi:hypothetical protein R1flu_023550 [Riccia fluitans]|uniref:Uncharacterized protein n=1 Tax=Riccia fluitans TaxID=41844 RepID=A0ABD1XSC6_9MARC
MEGRASGGVRKHKSPVEGSRRKYFFWTAELHKKFEDAENELGGFGKAPRKGVFEKLRRADENLTYAIVSNHWTSVQKREANNLMKNSNNGPAERRMNHDNDRNQWTSLMVSGHRRQRSRRYLFGRLTPLY